MKKASKPIRFLIEAEKYTSTVERGRTDLVYMKRQHHYQVKSRIVDVFGPLWIAGFSDLAPRSLMVESGGREFEPVGRYGFFAPAHSLIHWTVSPGQVIWEAVASASVDLPDALQGREPFLFEWNGSVPESFPALVEMLSGSKSRVYVDQQRTQSPLAQRVKHEIDHLYSERLSISKVASGLGYAWSYMTREFKKAYGVTPVEYRHRVRLFSAIRLLAQGKPVTEACFDSGFSSLTQFNWHFKRHLGALPTQYSYEKNHSKVVSTGDAVASI